VQVAEDLRAEAVHDLLADLRGDPGLNHAEGGGRGGDGDNADGEPEEQADVALG
jgi:hypothetical protein